MEISTKSIEVNNLISFSRSFNKSPELFILEKIIKKGYLVADIKLEFDQKGKIKDNYFINGFIKDTKLNLLEKYNIEKLDLIFSYQKENLSLEDILISLNNIKLFSKNISIKKLNNEFLVEGHLDHKNINLDKEQINLFIKPLLSNFNLEKINLSSKNKFSFKINKKLKLKNFKITSNVLLNEIVLLDNFNLKKIFPNSKNKIQILDNKLKIIYENENFLINGNGNISFQNKKDYIEYEIKKKNKVTQFRTYLIIKDNPLILEFLNYKKDQSFDTLINFEALNIENDKMIIKSLSLNENQNKIELKDVLFNKKFKIIDFNNIDLDYVDKENQFNSVKIYKKNKEYFLKGSSFNVDSIIESLLSDNKNNLDLININKKINIDIDKIRLDNRYNLEQFSGHLLFNNQKLISAKLTGNFLDKKKLEFTVLSDDNVKTTTLFLGKAEPIVKRYNFIKGFSEGELDLSSSKKFDESISTLKIYNFRLKELPLLTKILTLASLQGIADILSGEGLFLMNLK